MRHGAGETTVELVLKDFEPLHPLLTVAVHSELDVIASRLRARQIATLCHLGSHEQIRVAIAVSELARNAVVYAGGGRVRFLVGTTGKRQALVITIDDMGPGIPGLDLILADEAAPGVRSGGIPAARRFMDRSAIETSAEGTRIVLTKALPPQVFLDTAGIGQAIAKLEALPSNVALAEAHHQNRELSDALAALQAKQNELIDVSANLERTNRQVEALNARLHEKADSLVSADRRKDEFLSVLSHELRGPLSAAGMAAQLLEVDPDPAHRSVKLGQLITRQVRHMSSLVEDLLDVSRVSRGLVSISKVPVEMREVVDAALEQLSSGAQAKRHTVSVDFPLHPCVVEGDRTRLLQIVANLLGNAIRYTPEDGRIELLMRAEGAELLFRVSDNGIGIPAALMPHLFDLYTQAERSPNGRNSGLGLGLALVKSLVEAHGGRVSASSAGAGGGSQFEIRLAIAAPGPDAPEAAPEDHCADPH